MIELGIKHRYTKPYMPQTNGKVERFWRTLKVDLLEDSIFKDLEHISQELSEYIVYYNHERTHQALNNICPVKFLENKLNSKS